MKRALVFVAVGLVAVLAVAVWLLTQSLDRIVQRVIEEVGTEVVGAPVSVERVRVELREARATLGGLRVANPPGFSSQPAFSLGEISVSLDAASLTGSPIVLTEVRVIAPDVRFEVNGEGRANLNELRRHVEEGGSGKADKPSPEPAVEAEGEPVRIRIRRFTFEDGQLQADTAAVGGEAQALALTALHLTDVGGPGGAPPAEIARELLSAYLRKTTEAVARSGAQRYLERKIDETLGEAGEAAKGLLRGILEE